MVVTSLIWPSGKAPRKFKDFYIAFSLIHSCETGTHKMADQQFRALSSCLVTCFFVVIAKASNNGKWEFLEHFICFLVYSCHTNLWTQRHEFYLRNRKHVPWFYRWTRVEVWKNEKTLFNRPSRNPKCSDTTTLYAKFRTNNTEIANRNL